MNYKFFFKIIVLCLLLFTTSWAETITVITKENAIRESPKFLSPIKVFVKYGDVLDVIRKEKDWYRVKFRNILGYIHNTAVEERAVSPHSGYYPSTSTSEGEITLAGKGFNPQVEKAYKGKYPQMRYDLVDKIEKYDVSEQDIIYFIKSGGLLEPQ